MFARAYPGAGGRTVVDVGGLARSDAAGSFETEFTSLAGEISSACQASEPTAGAQGPAPGPAASGAVPAVDDPTEEE